ncbi:MAG: hypothetical protein ABR915_03360 [Thermoguttaceae bacterium]|jgi:hypothetical protein
MSLILDGCPFYEEATEADTPSGPILIRSYQMVAWVGLAIRGTLSRPFPAVIDTGHSHNFSIKEEYLELWAGLHAHDIQTIGHARVNKRLVELKDAGLAVYPNTPGERDALRDRSPYLLTLPEGIAVHRASDPFAPRLPLLGVRALVNNHLRIVIDGNRKEMSLNRE